MKTNYFPKTLVAITMMFLVWSCGTDPNIESARLALMQADFEEVIRSAEAAIEANPDNGDGYYYIAVAHASIASDQAPENRIEDYQLAREYFDEAKKRYEDQMITSDEAQNLPEIIIELWGYEHNEGIQPLTDDIINSEEDSLILSRHHLRNATTINPDSVQSYNVLAEVNFALGDLEKAEEITRFIIYDLQKADLFNYYRLAYFLMEREMDDEALEVLSDAREAYPDEIEIVQEMANAYLRIGETEKAQETIQELIERDPENPQYRLVYATQVYQMVQDLDSRIRDKHDKMYDLSREIRQKAREPNADADEIDSMVQEIDDLQAEAEELIEQSFLFSEDAEEQLLLAMESDPDSPDIHATLGIIYQNRAAVLQDQRNISDDDEEAAQFDERAREYLRKSIPHYKKAAELEEDNQDHWLSLFRVYTNLGMSEEAEHAQEQAGI